jgi:hypothetical protein
MKQDIKSMINVRFYRQVDCDTGNCLVNAKLWGRFSKNTGRTGMKHEKL